MMTMRWLRAAALGVLVLAGSVVNSAGPKLTTLSVPGRANANASLASSGSFVAAVWSASLPSGETDVFASVSRDGGDTFSAPHRVNATAGDARVNGEQPPRVALNPRPGSVPEIAVVWTTKGTAGTRLLSARSTDGGRSFTPSMLVPSTDAPGNRGWEGLGTGPDGRFFTVWLDHRKMAQPQETAMAAEHHHEGTGAATTSTSADGVAMAQLSQLYVAALDGSVAPQAVTSGVCYCCKTAIAAGPGASLFVAWRHVYPGNMRDIAFAASRDGGRTFGSPIRVSEDKWQIEGCPDDGPSMAVDKTGAVHIVWPAVVTERDGPVKALFHASSRDGVRFSPRQRIPTRGQANHPQLSIDANGTLAVTWDESGSGTRTLASAVGRIDASGYARFTRSTEAPEVGTYPVITSTQPGVWLRAWTAGSPSDSTIKLGRIGQ